LNDESRRDLTRMVGRIHYGVDHAEKLLLTVSRLDPQKGVDLAIRALALAPADHKLLVVGEGRELQSLESLVQELGLTTRVVFAGHQDRGGVAEALTSADAFLFPVRNAAREGLPIAVLEAAGAGLPVVVPNNSGWPDDLEPCLIRSNVEYAAELAEAMTKAAVADRVTLPPSFTMEGMAAAYTAALFG
jgi:glycosyltransferase involved in cell wall biosynthesis